MKVYRLNKLQLDRLSEFTSNLSLFFLASTIAPLFTGSVLKLEISIGGVVLFFGFFVISLIILKK